MPAALDELRRAAGLVEVAARDDRETIGEVAGAVERLAGELEELRDELVALALRGAETRNDLAVLREELGRPFRRSL